MHRGCITVAWYEEGILFKMICGTIVHLPQPVLPEMIIIIIIIEINK